MRPACSSVKHSTPILLACLLLALVAAASTRAETRPFQARVVTPRAAIRSGPGIQFYPTDTLAEGELVEVYRQQRNGWLAIRPPADSFSWVFGRHLNVLEKDLA